MDRKKGWKDFQTLVDSRPGYQAWLSCKDPEEKELRRELQELTNQVNSLTAEVLRIPMPARMDDVYLTRASLHINQRIAFELFIESLFELSLRQDSDETLNLLFAFLDTYTALLNCEHKYCKP